LKKSVLYNHTASSLSDLDKEIIQHVPPGGNWKNIPDSVPSNRLKQIRISFKEGKGSRSTYYGRLNSDKIAYTISTYFNRPGNGCYIHPKHNRLISQREAARLQSFPDNFEFLGNKTSIYKQIGNSVPVLLARAVATQFPKTTFYDLFCGAGGLSQGFILAGHKSLGGIDIDTKSIETFKHNHDRSKNLILCDDITSPETQEKIVNGLKAIIGKKELGLIIGGPPCQGFSTAGNRRSLKDPRNALPITFLDVVSKIKPKNFVMEEVTGLLNMEKGLVLEQILEKASEIGYTCTKFILHAEDYGVPQKRRRLFIFGNRSGKKIDRPKSIFGENIKGLKKIVNVKKAIDDLSSIPPTKEITQLKYSEGVILSPYQKWIRNIISFEQFIELQDSN
jgi:DNA (cytosine-5)-methyltransferase 1